MNGFSEIKPRKTKSEPVAVYSQNKTSATASLTPCSRDDFNDSPRDVDDDLDDIILARLSKVNDRYRCVYWFHLVFLPLTLPLPPLSH